MSTKKLVRLFKQAVIQEQVEVLGVEGSRGHMHFKLKHQDGRVQQLALSGSPTVFEHALANALKDVKRFRERV